MIVRKRTRSAVAMAVAIAGVALIGAVLVVSATRQQHLRTAEGIARHGGQ